MDEIKITLETLYDILRNEKKKEDLQDLEDTFFIDVVSYLREKKALLESKNEEDDIFAAGEKDKLDNELKSIKRIVKEIYEKREKKIIDIALNKSRTGSDIIDTSAMLREEKDFYESTLEILDKFRKGVVLNIFKGELPEIIRRPSKTHLFTETPVKKVPQKEKKEIKENNEKSEDKQVEEKDEEPVEKTKVKFIHPMPSFVWKDMKVYGPFDVGEELEIYSEVAELLVRKKRAVKI